MKLLKKDYIKGTIVIFISIIILSIFVIQVQIYQQQKKYEQIINKAVVKIIANVLEKYPELEIDTIQSLMNKKVEIEQIEEKMSLYGINPKEVVIIKKLQQEFEKDKLLYILITIGLEILLVISFLCYLQIRDREIRKITSYISKVKNKEYRLELEDNTEGELSRLKSELYKITVMLREQNDNLKQEKISLADSLSDISHQIKTPLTSMSIIIDALQNNRNMKEEKRVEFINELSKQIDWINWLILSLLKLSKLDAGTIVFSKERVNVKEIFQKTIENLSIPIEIKNIQIEIIQQEQWIIIDKNWIIEALTNIIKNDIEHSPQNGKIEIKCIQNNLYTKIIIKDEGSGISPEDMPHIFERFYKGKNASTNSVGIGLAIAKAIIEKQDGEIYLYSKLNEGTTFEIVLYEM